MGETINAEKLRQRLLAVQGTQASIGALSQYFHANQSEARRLCAVWWDAFQAAPADKLLALLYVLNDVVQKTRNKTQAFLEGFTKSMERAFELAARRSPDSEKSIRRIIDVWSSRQVFSQRYVGVLEAAVDRGLSADEDDELGGGGGGGRPSVASGGGGTASVASPGNLNRAGGSSAVDASAAADADHAMRLFAAMTDAQALQEAQRRRRLVLETVATIERLPRTLLLGEVPAGETETVGAGAAAGLDEGARAARRPLLQARLGELIAAERTLRLAQTILKMDAARRSGFLAKAGECVAAASERAARVCAEHARYAERQTHLRGLAAAQVAGASIRRRVQHEQPPPPLAPSGAAPSCDGAATASAAQQVDAPWNDDDLMADDWGGVHASAPPLPPPPQQQQQAEAPTGVWTWGAAASGGCSLGDAGAAGQAASGEQLMNAYAAQMPDGRYVGAASAGFHNHVPAALHPQHPQLQPLDFWSVGNKETPAALAGATAQPDEARIGQDAGGTDLKPAFPAAKRPRHNDGPNAAGTNSQSSGGNARAAEQVAPPLRRGGSSARASSSNAGPVSVEDLIEAEGMLVPSSSHPAAASAAAASAAAAAQNSSAAAWTLSAGTGLDLQSLIGPGRRWDGLRGAWVDDSEHAATEESWRDH